ncbi:MAG: glucose-6-phosphate dehydrogenase [Chloroflexota bacterium]
MTSAPPLANPLRAGPRIARTPQPSALVIFGATGDLTARKIVPALYNLALQRLLPAAFAVVGAARAALTSEQYREQLHTELVQFSRTKPINEDVWRSFAESVQYVSTKDGEGYETLRHTLADLDVRAGTNGNRLFYLATPPSAYGPIIDQLIEHRLTENVNARVVIEKPFGRDQASAIALSEKLQGAFTEDEIFRIDHYLGKETVQNILVLRFANGIFEPIWNRQYVDHIQITVAESLGIEERGAYYEQAGGLRDIVQNHLLQLLALVTMEPPVAFDAKAVRDEKLKVLRAVRPIAEEDVESHVVRGQYGPGFIEGAPVRGYRDEDGVAKDSKTDTFVAIRAFVDNWRWEGTPFYLRTGKRLPKRTTEIAIQFRAAPHQVFSHEAAEGMEPNALVLRIQPDEGISLKFGAKVPVQGIRIRSVNMDFVYGASFMVDAPDAYETLILDALRGDGTLFTRQDEVEQQWRFVDSIAKAWAQGQSDLPVYPSGSWGPTEADLLIARDGRAWRKP